MEHNRLLVTAFAPYSVENELIYRALFETANDAFLLTGQDGAIQRANPKAAGLFGYSPKELSSMTIRDIICPDDYRNIEDRMLALLPGERFPACELSFATRAGDVLRLEISMAVIPAGEGYPKLIQMIGRDIAGRRPTGQEQGQLLEEIHRSRERLRLLTYHLENMQEAESSRIAGVLHDQVGQNLTGLNLILQMVQNKLRLDSRLVESDRLNEALQIVEDVTRQVRDVMADLHPPMLEEFGLFSALDWYSGVFARRTGIAVQVLGGEFSPRLPPEGEAILFRIAQEALNNVAKHAQAQHVTILLTSHSHAAGLCIEDDGQGFNTASLDIPSKSTHWGILSMQERAASVGGQLSIQSDPGKGTCIQVNLER